MFDWAAFAKAALEISDAGARLLAQNEVAFLATASATGRPRIHPFVPKIVDGKLLAFIMDSSPKITDLRDRRQYAIHAQPGAEDEEFFISGNAHLCEDDKSLRDRAADAMGFATGVDEHHILFEFLVDRALWTMWADFGTPNHRPNYTLWSAQA
jgi:hypothetical protein